VAYTIIPVVKIYKDLKYSVYNPNGVQITKSLAYTVPSVTITTVGPTTGNVPINIHFIGVAVGVPSTWVWTWDFDDPDGVTVVNSNTDLIHQYCSYGTYSVTCTAATTGNSFIADPYQIVLTQLTTPMAEWYPNTDFGINPLTVTFYNYSSTYGGLANTYDWDFGDGTAHSSDTNPTHTFTTDNTFLVILTATNTNGSSTMSKYITTYSVEPDPVADFECTSPVGVWPYDVSLTVTDINGHTDTVSKTIYTVPNIRFTVFKDLSTGKIKHWEWDFGDGNK
jgi:PKD repeat protein